MDNKMTAEQALQHLYQLCWNLPANDEYAAHELIDFLRQALSAPRVPDGWIIRRGNDGAIVVQKHGVGGYAAREMGGSGIAESILYHLADAMLAASPEPVATVYTAAADLASFGLPAGALDWCGNPIDQPEPVADSEWIDIPANLRRQTNLEQHGQQVIADLRAEVEALKGGIKGAILKESARWEGDHRAAAWLALRSLADGLGVDVSSDEQFSARLREGSEQ